MPVLSVSAFSNSSLEERKKHIHTIIVENQKDQCKKLAKLFSQEELEYALKTSTFKGDAVLFDFFAKKAKPNPVVLQFLWQQAAMKGHQDIIELLLPKRKQASIVDAFGYALSQKQLSLSNWLFDQIVLTKESEEVRVLVKILSASTELDKLDRVLGFASREQIFQGLVVASATKNKDTAEVLMKHPFALTSHLPLANAIRLQDGDMLDVLLPHFDVPQTLNDLKKKGYPESIEWFQSRVVQQDLQQSTPSLSSQSKSPKKRF